MYSERQKQMLGAITRGLGLAEPKPGAVTVEQSPSYVDSVIETADFAVTALGAVGSTVATIGERRGLGSQQVHIDRRHAQLLFNEVAYFFQSGWQFDLGPVFTPVNIFYRTRDDREIFFNGAYQHLRDGILRFLDCPGDHAAIARRVAQFDAQALEHPPPVRVGTQVNVGVLLAKRGVDVKADVARRSGWEGALPRLECYPKLTYCLI